ncbi:MAG: hypothetical protein A2Z20_02415 [Bdellovibrionales bacterium RBG_16_40_8]|nr:MAG: hypothetical protein A2Z20_02415 [Bdellovibrionales bacterium RBG_16_40_8]
MISLDKQHDEAMVLLRELEVLMHEDWVQNPYGGVNPVQFEIFQMTLSIRTGFGSEQAADIDGIRKKYKNLMEQMRAESKVAAA